MNNIEKQPLSLEQYQWLLNLKANNYQCRNACNKVCCFYVGGEPCHVPGNTEKGISMEDYMTGKKNIVNRLLKRYVIQEILS